MALKSTPMVLNHIQAAELIEKQRKEIEDLKEHNRQLSEACSMYESESETFIKISSPHGDLIYKAYNVKMFDIMDGLAKVLEPRHVYNLKELIAIGKRP